MSYHFIGIGGIGMSGLARMLLQKGHKVSGSDMASSYVTESLVQQGAKVFIGHAKEHVPEGAKVIYSTDIPQDNPEYTIAKEKQYPIMHRSDLLLSLMQGQKVIAIAGTHGKTTTTSLLIHIFHHAGLDPAFAVGGMMTNLGTNAAFGNGGLFIAEADESDGTFLKYPYEAAICTNIDNDHIAHYGSWERLVENFITFLNMAKDPERLFFCQDDPHLASLGIKGTSYGFSEKANLRLTNFRQEGWQIHFDLNSLRDVACNLTGRHNALNAAACIGLAQRYGIPEKAIREALAAFQGVKRRLEKKGEAKGIVAIDDYAHHPTEIRETLKAVRGAIKDQKLVAIFQPHRYSRMRYVMKDFDHVFEEADLAIVTDLYTAKEEPVAGVSTESILHEIQKTKPGAIYLPRSSLVKELAEILPERCVVITMGAGDITKVGKELVEFIEKK